jgi:hypothetical protein
MSDRASSLPGKSKAPRSTSAKSISQTAFCIPAEQVQLTVTGSEVIRYGKSANLRETRQN